METRATSQELRGRKQVLLRARPGLEVLPRAEGSRTSYVVKDPVGLDYHRLEQEQYRLLTLLNGSLSLEELREELRREVPTLRPLADLLTVITFCRAYSVTISRLASTGSFNASTTRPRSVPPTVALV